MNYAVPVHTGYGLEKEEEMICIGYEVYNNGTVKRKKMILPERTFDKSRPKEEFYGFEISSIRHSPQERSIKRTKKRQSR